MSRKVLLVDDESLVRSFIGYVLKPLNFEIVEADTEKKAWAAYLQHEDQIELAIIEIDLIYGDGYRLYQRIRERSKKVVVVLCRDCLVFPFEEVTYDPRLVLLVKPFSADKLIQSTQLIDGTLVTVNPL